MHDDVHSKLRVERDGKSIAHFVVPSCNHNESIFKKGLNNRRSSFLLFEIILITYLDSKQF